MRSAVALLLVGVHLVYSGRHSLQYFYTSVSGEINFPEFTSVGLVDGQQFMYFDSNIMKAVPKTDWIKQNVGEDYWNTQTDGLKGEHQIFMDNIKTVIDRFNQSAGIHTWQNMYGCSWDDETGDVDGFDEFGYNGEDFISLDVKNWRYITTLPIGVITQDQWNKDKHFIEHTKYYRTQICIEWLKKYLQYGKSTLQREVAPVVSLLQKDSSSPVICHATSFYPRNIIMTWKKHGEDQNEDVEISETLPNEDGTFQKRISISVRSEEWKKNPDVYRCVIQHVGKEKEIEINEDNVRSNTASLNISVNIIAIVVGCVVALALVAAIIGLVMWKKSKGYKKANNQDTDSENSDQPLPKA